MSRWETRLVVPGEASFLRIVRLVTSDVAARAGFDLDEIDDVRMAVNELCGLVVGARELDVRWIVDDGALALHGVAPGGRADDVDEIAGAILGVLCDRYELSNEGDHVVFALSKSARGG